MPSSTISRVSLPLGTADHRADFPHYPDLSGKVFIVTGASSGMGAETVRLLARQGACVVLAARRLTACQALQDELGLTASQALSVACDVSQEADVSHLVARTLAHFGRLHGAFNNAGTLGRAGPVDQLTDQDYLDTFAVNVRGAFHCLRHQTPALRANGGGVLVFNASMAATVGFAQIGPYVASKHAVLGLVRSAALELGAQGIRVNALCPGVIDTPMGEQGFGGRAGLLDFVATTPAQRAGTVTEVAAMACFLLSSASSFVNGQALLADGGYTAA